MIVARNIDNALIYDYRFDLFFSIDTGVQEILQPFISGTNIRIITAPVVSGMSDGDRQEIYARLKGVFSKRGMIAAANKLSRSLKRNKPLRLEPGKKNIIMDEPVYELQFLKDRLSGYNVLNCNIENYALSGNHDSPGNAIGLGLFEPGFCSRADAFEALLLKDLQSDFIKNIGRYLCLLNRVRSFEEKNPVSLGIWDIPPVGGAKALIFEYLRSKKIHVIGAQHGCVYGDSYEPWHFDSDFKRCDSFISYGFIKDDLEALYPGVKFKTDILPLGKSKIIKQKSKTKQIDILFPIAKSTSMLVDGMIRTPPEELVERQIKILEYLNSIEGVSIYVKPFMHSGNRNCAVFSVLKRLKNLKVVNNMTLSAFLSEYSARAVIIEFPSQPLFEVLHLDTEIFLMDDCMHPYSDIALEELKKRVYYTGDITQMIANLGLFLNGGLPTKRDDTFLNHYVHKKNSREDILKLISDITKRS